MFLNDGKILWKKMALYGGIVAGLCLFGIFWFDLPLFKLFRHLEISLWHIFDLLGGFPAWGAFCIAFLGVFFICSGGNIRDRLTAIFHHKYSRTVIHILCALIIAAIITWMLKVGLGRMRPLFMEGLGLSGFYPFSFNWAFNSFPSGHSAACFAGLVSLGLMFPRLKPYTWTLAIISGLSRIALGVHWPSDVLLGAYIGMCSADLSYYLWNKFSQKLLKCF